MAAEKEFNEHIDLCLSREKIRDSSTTEQSLLGRVSDVKKLRSSTVEKRNDNRDPKQLRLCFK
jgi:DNA polymerase kappa